MEITSLKIILLCGIGLIIISLLYTIVLTILGQMHFTPVDFASIGLAFIGFVMAWPQFERDFKVKKI